MEPQPFHVKEILVEELVLSKENVRQDAGDVTGLKDSMTEQGMLQPLIARPADDGKFHVHVGGRRLEAARQLGLHTLPVKIEEVSQADAVLCSLTENLNRNNLTLTQRVHAYKRLEELDRQRFTTRGLAKLTGLKQSKIVQDMDAYEARERLSPYGIEVITQLSPANTGRAEGTALPERHATMLQQTMKQVGEQLTQEQVEVAYPALARLIAPLNQPTAKLALDTFKEQPDKPISIIRKKVLGHLKHNMSAQVAATKSLAETLPHEATQKDVQETHGGVSIVANGVHQVVGDPGSSTNNERSADGDNGAPPHEIGANMPNLTEDCYVDVSLTANQWQAVIKGLDQLETDEQSQEIQLAVLAIRKQLARRDVSAETFHTVSESVV